MPKPVSGSVGVHGGEDEFDRLWEETSELGEDDYELYREEREERTKSAAEWRDEFARKVGGTTE